MDTLSVRAFRQLKAQFGALASVSRLRIVQLLAARGPLTVTEIRDAVDVSQPLLSWHLSILRRAGLVQTTKEGRQVFYTLAPQETARLRAHLDAVLSGEPLSQVQPQPLGVEAKATSD
jgi:DNA-binding transcriptional ArsR family regulator